MTKAEFIKKFKDFLYENAMSGAILDTSTTITMCFENCQSGDIENDYVSLVGFDEDDDLFIDFIDTRCTAYSDELDCNSNDAWDLLWNAILTEYDCVDEVKAHDFKIGDKVFWTGCDIENYPQEDRESLLVNRYVVIDVKGYDIDSIITITDCYSDVEVTPNEITHIHKK
jgi:hypothetical protein